jgi:hypothetical protein
MLLLPLLDSCLLAAVFCNLVLTATFGIAIWKNTLVASKVVVHPYKVI